MIRLDRIYTRGGDEGETSLGDGSRVSKLNARIAAGGSVDEMNCVLGAAASVCEDVELRAVIFQLQQFLFDLGADLSVPLSTTDTVTTRNRVQPEHARWMEGLIDGFVAQLQPLQSFVLPGGTPAAAALHHARSVCRRAELDVLRLASTEAVNSHLLVSLNRLSDLLFVMARMANRAGELDVLWVPGRST